MSNYDHITRSINKDLKPIKSTLHDIRGDDMHFSLSIEAEAFNGKTLLDMHKMIYESVGMYSEECGIHAISISAKGTK